MALFAGISIDNYRIVVVAVSMFTMWLFNLILLKLFGMKQEIYKSADIDKMDKILLRKHKDSVPLHRMLTRAIDRHGTYRRRAMTNHYIIYGSANLTMFCILIFIIATNSGWLYAHFIESSASSVPYVPYQVFTCIGFSYFVFELVYTHQFDYFRVDRTLSSHHWVAVFASLFAMNGVCMPWATFYGINATILSFPSCWFIAWVFSEGSFRFPQQTRLFARYIHAYHCTVSLWNVTGTVYLCVNALKRESVEPVYIVAFACVAAVWIYDDFNTMQWLEMLSVHPYQDVQFYRKRNE